MWEMRLCEAMWKVEENVVESTKMPFNDYHDDIFRQKYYVVKFLINATTGFNILNQFDYV